MYDPQQGRWVPSREVIESFPGGAVARHGPTRVIFDNDLATGVIDAELSNGVRLRSRLRALSFSDGTKTVLLAQVTNCVGRIARGNQVIYDNAFDNVNASVIYTYTKASFSQDVLIKTKLASPADFSLDPRTTILQAITEFIDVPEPAVASSAYMDRSGAVVQDETLDWGAVRMAAGKAWMTGEGPGRKEVRVSKRWHTLEGEGCRFLIEQIPYPEVEQMLSTLPEYEGAAARPVTTPDRMLAALARRVPALPGMADTNAMEVAEVGRAGAGLLVDYVMLATSATNYAFNSTTTYYISSQVSLVGETTITGGAVLKVAETNTAKLSLAGPLVCRTSPFKMAVITSANDNGVGETISGSTGNPSSVNGGTFLDGVSYTNDQRNLSYLRFLYAGKAVRDVAHSLNFSHCQFVKCQTAVEHSDDGASVGMDNVLATQCGTLVAGWANLAATHLTADQTGQWFGQDHSGLSASFTNCLLTATTNACVNRSLGFQNTVQSPSSAGFYEAAGAGHYYLISGSTNRNAATANISSTLLAELREKTTYPPAVYSNVSFSAPTTLGPQAQRDTDALDIGFHYDRLDYLCAKVTVAANVTLTLTNGVAIGAAGSQAFGLASEASVAGGGSPLNPNVLVRCAAVQEQPLAWGGTPGYVFAYAPSWPDHARVSLRFTDIALLSGAQTLQDTVSSGPADTDTVLADCRLWGVNLGVRPYTGFARNLDMRNCLVHRGILTAWGGASPGPNVTLRNNTFVGGSVTFNYSTSALPWAIYDNLFDTVSLVKNPSGAPYPANGCNAYNVSVRPTASGAAAARS